MTLIINTEIQEQIVVKFTVDDGDDIFPGALVLKKSEYDLLSPESLEVMQTEKYNEWKTARTPPTPEELAAQQVARLASIPVIQEQLTVEEAALKVTLGVE